MTPFLQYQPRNRYLTKVLDIKERFKKLFSRWSVSVERSTAGNQDYITDTRTVLWPAEN